MHYRTPALKEEIQACGSLREKLALLEDAYPGETCYVLTCGPSISENWSEELRAFLRDKLVMSVKQTYELGPEICDFHIMNSWNYHPYSYQSPAPIVISEYGDDDPETPGLQADLLFYIPDPRNFEERLATTWHFDEWLLANRVERPWGPGVMYELCFPLLVHMGVKEIITLGWDLGELNVTTMQHFFKEVPEDMKGDSDGVYNKPRIRPYEVGDIAESTKALYYWLRSKGIYLYIVSNKSLVDPIVPRITLFQDYHSGPEYESEIIGNGNFNAWDQGGGPALWVCKPSCEVARPATGPGGTAFELKPAPGEGMAMLFQQVQLEPFFAGARIRASMEACCSEAGRFALVVAVFTREDKNNPYILKQDHPGDGEWQTLEVSGTIPADINPHYVRITAQLRPGAKRSAFGSGIRTWLGKKIAMRKDPLESLNVR